METLIAAFGLQKIIVIVLGIAAFGFILKKLFKLAITLLVITAFIYYGVPIVQTMLVK